MRSPKEKAVLTLIMMLFPGALAAAGGEQSLFPSLGRLVVAFIVVVMLLYAAVFLLRKFVMKNSGKASASIKPMGSYPLGQRSKLFLVEIAGRAILLGVTPQQVSNLAEFEVTEIKDSGATSGLASFKEHLHRFTHPGKGEKGLSTG
ncbi:MAG: flagellar biosynthetic protein FliO [Candidatus Krumholzibacteriota bacterium]|nr:flagellar biosynthetic protein FliO [Candidatus Krumholzibacteriota bacterium]